jgi:DNA-binding transcriptional LysR family regulator
MRLPTCGGRYGWEFKKNVRELHVRVEGQLVFNGEGTMFNAALNGLGFAYLPEGPAQTHVSKGRLVRVL